MRRFLEDIDSPNVEAILDPVNLISADNHLDQDEVINKGFPPFMETGSKRHPCEGFCDEGRSAGAFAYVGDGLLHYETLMRNLEERQAIIAMLLEEFHPERYHKWRSAEIY